MSYLSVNAVTAGYGRQNVIEHISFDLESGHLMGVIGSNGSGKTTLMKALCGILPHGGTCFLEGAVLENLSARQMARLVSYIPQRSGIAIDISALDVVLMGFNPHLGLLEHPTGKMKEAAMEALTRVGLAGKEETNYLHLSEGQKQLCILARTLVSESRILLLDEPESALDFRYRYRMLAILKQWVSQGTRAAILTLHDPGLALNYCDRLILLSEGSVAGILNPVSDSLTQMEEQLSRIYGDVSLHRCRDHQGMEHLVMLKEREDEAWSQ